MKKKKQVKWWEATANEHSKRDEKAGKQPGKCPCMVCQRARQEGFMRKLVN